jgi:hypothetical protein
MITNWQINIFLWFFAMGVFVIRLCNSLLCNSAMTIITEVITQTGSALAEDFAETQTLKEEDH